MMDSLALTLLASALSALAQNAYIALPAQGSNVTRGTNITVQVTKPNSLTGSTSVALALGLPSTTAWSPSCQSIPSDGVLYSGAFKPVYHEPALPPYHEPALPPYQNFTVYVPQGLRF